MLELSGVTFGYTDRPPILCGADLTLAAGERLCVTGANGSGKSTLLRLIVGLIRPTAGTITAFGHPCLGEADFAKVRRRVGLVFQDPDDQLFCPTVAEDVAFGPLNLGQTRDKAMATVARVLAQLDLRHLQDRVTYQLSGGERRLVTLATVLAMNPEVLLLDEPTNALDADNQARLTDVLQALPHAMVIVSHDAAFRAALGNRALVLQNGQLSPVAQDPVKTV
nr:ABC transporter ATP-binding protein [Actibacterium sp. 188UL27-1]